MQLTLDGDSPIDISIAILREFEPPEGYYLAFSGGKDSCVLKALADEAGVAYDAHYSMTTIDPPELTRFINREHPDVEWEVPEHNFFAMVRRKGLPMRNARWCCAVFKEVGGIGRRVLLGLRAEESAARAKRGVFAPCTKRKRWFVSPIMYWTTADVWEFIRDRDLPYCSLYDEGWKRLGCIVCPFEEHVEQSMARWPVIWRLMEEAATARWHDNERMQELWETPEAMWEWWIDRHQPYPDPDAEKPPTLAFEIDEVDA